MKRNVIGNKPSKQAMAVPTSPKVKGRASAMEKLQSMIEKKALKAKKSRGNNSK